MQERHQYEHRMDLPTLEKSEHEDLVTLKKNEWIERPSSKRAALEILLDLLQQVLRGYRINHEIIDVSTTEELEKVLRGAFPEEYENIITHFTCQLQTYPELLVKRSWLLDFKNPVMSDDALVEEGEKIKEIEKKIGEFKSTGELNESVFDLYSENKIIYFKATSLVTLDPQFPNKKVAVEVLFKLTEKGFQLYEISTNQDLVKHLVMFTENDKKQIKEKFIKKENVVPVPVAVPQLSRWQRFKQKWQAMSNAPKVVAAFAILAGIAAIVVGVFFPPSLAVTLPYVGKLAASALLTYGGAALVVTTAVLHTVHIVKTPLPEPAAPVAPIVPVDANARRRRSSSDAVVTHSLSRSPSNSNVASVTESKEEDSINTHTMKEKTSNSSGPSSPSVSKSSGSKSSPSSPPHSPRSR